MQRLPYLGDPKLIPRVQKYLEANVDKTYIDIGLMADELQNTYREYSRRKRNAFRASVKKAYSIVLRSYGLDDQSDDSSEEKVDEEAESENSRENHFQHNNIMNNQLVELYTRSSSNVPKMNENELIDISSDDSKEEGRVPPAKSSNGPSTSSKPTRIDFSNNFQENMEKISALQGKKRKMEEKSLGQTNKKKKIEVPAEVPQINLLDNVVGIDSIVNQLVEDLLPFKFPHVYLHSDKVKPPRGFLLYGLSGCGKTFIATAIAGHLGFPFIQVCASELASGISGDTEKLIRELFKRAVSSAPCVLFIDNFHALMNDQTNSQQPKMKNSVIAEICHCIDELDKNPAADRVILIAATTNLDCVDTSLRADGRFSEEIRIGVPKEESRIAILKTLTSSFKLAPDFDWNRIAAETPGYVGADLKKLVKSTWRNAFVKMVRNELANSRNNMEVQEAPEESDEIKDSNKSEAEIIVDDDSKETTEKGKIDSSQDENLVLVIEDENSKQEDEDISSSTVPTEINSLGDAEKVTETPMEQDVESEPPKESTVAPTLTLSARILEETGNLRNLDQLVITENDFLQAAKQIKPLAIKQGLCTVPKVCWDDIGSLQNVRNELKRTLLEPIKRKKAYEEFGIDVPAGVLLCGPPGCGKTLLAKALANEANLNFFSVKGPEVINMYVGESEKAVRKCFEKAKNAAPSLIFFDELDALCPRRKANGESDVISRIVNAMLIEMDGVEDRDGVYLLAATNRPDIIDNAVLRPGRLDKILYVGIPTAEDRVEILRAITKNGSRPRLGPDVDLEIIGRLDELSRYTGADLSALVKEASRLCIERTAIGEEWILNSEDFHRAISKIRPSITEEDKQHYDKMKEKYNNGAT